MLVAVSFNGGTTYHSGLSGTMNKRDGGVSTSNVVRFQKANVPPYVLFGGDDVASNLQTYTIMAEEDTDLYISGIHIIDEDLKTYVAHEKEGKTGRKWGGGKTGSKMVLDRKITVTLRAYVMTPERTPLDNVLFFGEEAATTLSGTCTCAHEDYVTANAASWAEKDDINYNLSLLKLRVSAKLHTTHHTPHTAHHTPYTVHRTPHTAHSTQHTAHGTRHTHPPCPPPSSYLDHASHLVVGRCLWTPIELGSYPHDGSRE